MFKCFLNELIMKGVVRVEFGEVTGIQHVKLLISHGRKTEFYFICNVDILRKNTSSRYIPSGLC